MERNMINAVVKFYRSGRDRHEMPEPYYSY